MIKETSYLAYCENKISGRNLAQRMQILEFIKANQPCSRNQIVAGLGLRISSVTGRVRELIETGQVEVAFKAPDPITKRLVEFLRIKDKEIIA
jgi:predicted transcriptional regulator